MKINLAYCITCHKYSKILNENVKILSENNDIYIHVDKKSDIREFEVLKERAKFIENRVEVTWGDYSQIESTLKLLEKTREGKYDYIFLISGDDLPLKNDEDIKKFLYNNKGKEFIEIKEDIAFLEDRLKYKYNKLLKKREKNLFEKLCVKILKKFKLFRKNEYYEFLPKIYGGSNWFCISNKFRDYVFKFLEENPNYIKAFFHSICGDEEFFQTIISNSEYKEKIYVNKIRYIDWESGPEYPKILNQDDFKKILESEALFARKFSDNLDLKSYKEFFKIN